MVINCCITQALVDRTMILNVRAQAQADEIEKLERRQEKLERELKSLQNSSEVQQLIRAEVTWTYFP